MSDIAIIQRKIYEVRGQKVILDRDLAVLYQVETRVLNQSVKRNKERFPDDFMFQLTQEEWQAISSQIVMTSSPDMTSQNVMTSPQKRPLSALPYAFTEHGVVMLASLLRSDIAIRMSVQITRAFVAMRQALTAMAATEAKIELLNEKIERLNLYIEDVMHDQNDINEAHRMQLEAISIALSELQMQKRLQKPRRRIGYDVKPDEEYIE